MIKLSGSVATQEGRCSVFQSDEALAGLENGGLLRSDNVLAEFWLHISRVRLLERSFC